MWIGGLLSLTGVIAGALTLAEPGKLKSILLRIWFATIPPGLALVVLSGGYQFQKLGFSTYIEQNWFLTKLLCVGVLVFVSIYQKHMICNLDSPTIVSKGKLRIVRILGTLLFLTIVTLTIFNRV